MDVQRGQEDVDLYDDFDLRKQLTPLQSRDKKRKIMPINQWKAPLIEMKILLRKYSYFHLFNDRPTMPPKRTILKSKSAFCSRETCS